MRQLLRDKGAAFLMVGSLLVPASHPQAGPHAGELIYSRLEAGTWQIWSRDLLSGRDEQITSDPGDKRYPGWTPDGSVFFQTINQGCVILREGEEGELSAVEVLPDLWPVRDVAWSPDGSKVALSRIRTDLVDAANLFVADPAGRDRLWLTREPGIQYMPSWSPDGAQLVFVGGHGWGTYELELIKPDGSDRTKLTENQSHEFLPAWSPDGSTIAFVSDRSGDFEIWAMPPSGGEARMLTDREGLDTRPAWSPDGKHIAYSSSRAGTVEIWVMASDGSNPRPLIQVPGGARDPSWRARPAADPVAKTSEGSTSPASSPLLLTEVGLDRKTLDDGTNEDLEIRFRVSGRARARIDLVDEAGVVCRRLLGETLEPGRHSLSWDGLDSEGRLVPSGVYRYVLIAEDEFGNRAVHDPSRDAWGEDLQPEEFTFDSESGRLRWIQPRAGFVRLRVAVTGFPLLRTLLDWEPLEAGEQLHEWDGLDGSGLIQLNKHPNLWITLETFSMPANTVIVRAASEAASAPSVLPDYPPLVAGPAAHRAAQKPLDGSIAPSLSLEFPEEADLDSSGRPILRGVVPVRVSLASRDLASMTDALFEVAFYVDLTFFFEDEESTSPMTWLWDTHELPPGPHLLTVNVFSYDGRIGCLTRQVVIGEPR